MPTISVIIPIYNAEKYLRKCLDSVLGQTHRDLEVILVDDGSTDNSGQICEEYTKDQRVKLIRKKNGGAASARNIGLSVTTGDLIHFVDSDDYLELNMYEKLLKIIAEDDADFIGFSCFFEYENGEHEIYGYNDSKIRLMAANEYFESCLRKTNILMPWGYICSSKLWKNIKFPENIIFVEDAFAIIPIILNATKIVCVGIPFYHWYLCSDSISRGKITLAKISSFFLMYDYWFACSKKYGWNVDKLIINNYHGVVKNFVLLTYIRFRAFLPCSGNKKAQIKPDIRKMPTPAVAKLFCLVPYPFVAFGVKLISKICKKKHNIK